MCNTWLSGNRQPRWKCGLGPALLSSQAPRPSGSARGLPQPRQWLSRGCQWHIAPLQWRAGGPGGSCPGLDGYRQTASYWSLGDGPGTLLGEMWSGSACLRCVLLRGPFIRGSSFTTHLGRGHPFHLVGPSLTVGATHTHTHTLITLFVHDLGGKKDCLAFCNSKWYFSLLICHDEPGSSSRRLNTELL